MDITPGHARRVAQAAAAVGATCVVAPYEADAQMAYLARTGAVAAVVTEDSDLLPYGAPTVLFKLDRDGTAQRVRLADVPSARNPRLSGFDATMFIELCALSGCDFVESLQSVGVKTAARLMAKHRSADRVVRSLRLAGKTVPADYEARVARAVATYRHQRVWCEKEGRVVHLTPLPEGGLPACLATLAAATPDDDGTHFLGPPLEAAVAQGVAEGRLDPMTRRPYSALPPLPPPRQEDGGGRAMPPPPAQPPARTLANTLASMWRRAGASVHPAGPPPQARASQPAAFPRRTARSDDGAPPTASHITGLKRPAPGARAALHADGASSQLATAGGVSQGLPSQSTLPSSAPALLEGGVIEDEDEGCDDVAQLEQEMAAERAAAHATPARAAAAAALSPSWPGGATPTGWRDFYGDTPPASAAKKEAPPAQQRSAHFAQSPEEAAPPPPPPPPPPHAKRAVVAGLFGGLTHVNGVTAAARKAVSGGDSGDENADARGGGGKRAKGNAFARFAFNNAR